MGMIDLEQKAFSPYRWYVAEKQLKYGTNEVCLTVSTGIIALFEGEVVYPVTQDIINI